MHNDIKESAGHIPDPCHIPDQRVLPYDNHQPTPSGRTAKRLFGKLYECLAGNAACDSKSIPFGSMRICSWPLKEHADGLEVHIPPCLDEKE